MKAQKVLAYLTMVALVFLLSCGEDKSTNPNANTDPSASFAVNPISGTTETTFNVDASSSTDNQDSSSALQVHWDWENDGTYDTDWTTTKMAEHRYSSEGIWTIKLEVKDIGGLTDTETHHVTVSFQCGVIVTDIDGNTYQTIQIGGQCWMAENLKVTRYRNGDAIPNIPYGPSPTTGVYCNFDNIPDLGVTYGRLYNWYAVNDSRSLAPEGWHVPSAYEWETLVYYLGGDATAGGKMKAIGTFDEATGLWYSPNTGATNESGFSALPGGFRWDRGGFYGMGTGADFWSSDDSDGEDARCLTLSFESAETYRYDQHKRYGFSVRCVKD